MENAIAGVSGGRSSAMMALALPSSTVLTFQNTGFEHPGTIEFLRWVEADLGREIIKLEYRAPPRGDPPRAATFEVMSSWSSLSMKGEPFLDMLECARTFREQAKDEGPIAPWARQRICTAHLKIKTQHRYALSLGWREWTSYAGLRADEPDRIAKMRERNERRASRTNKRSRTVDVEERAPLDEQGVTKPDVLRFFAGKGYDLTIPEHLGNCTGCFLKDEKDLASALLDPTTQAEKWIAIERDYAPMRRGRTSYAEVLAEAPERMKIRAALQAGLPAVSSLPPRRHRLLVLQEQTSSAPFSCSCEAAEIEAENDLFDWAESHGDAA